MLVSWWAAVKGGRQSDISLSLLPWAGASRKLWQLPSVVLWEFLQHRVLVSLPQLDDTRPGGDNEPYKEKWRCKNKMKSKLCSFEGKKAFTDVKSCGQFHLRCVSCLKWIRETTNSLGRLISWPESQNINSVSLNSKIAPLFPFVLFFTAKATPPFSAETGRALRVTPSQLTSIQEALEKQLAVRGLGNSEACVVRWEAGEASGLAGLVWAHL